MGRHTFNRSLLGASALTFAAAAAVPRGLRAVRADAGTPSLADLKASIDALNKLFADFKVENDKQLADKFKDVVQNEKVDRINAEIDKQQAALDDALAAIAALQVGGGGDGKPVSAEKRAHATAFDRFFRKGVDADLRDLEVKAGLRTDSDPDGGYVAPDEVEAAIDRVLGTVSSMRQIARIVSISTGAYKKLVSQGGAAGGWVGERESRPETNTPTLAALDFPAMELYANPATTQTLLDDARVDIGAWLADEVAITFAEMEGAAFISGSGVNRPRGLLSYNTVANASYAWGSLGYIATAVAADINDGTHNGVDALIDLVYSIKQGYRSNARFLMNRTLQGKIRKLKMIGDVEGYLWQPPVQAGQPATLLGYPITDDDNMPDVGANTYPVAFGDFMRGYTIVDRIGIRVLRDPFTNKPYIMFYTTKRVGGGVSNFEAIKLLKCAAS